MALLKSRTVKKCVCGKDRKATMEWTDRDQAFSILLILGGAMFVAGTLMVGSISPKDYNGWVDPRVPIAILVATAAYFAYLVAKNGKRGHSLKCSLRQALYKV